MKLEIIKRAGKMNVGETFIPRTDEQGEALVKQGYAKKVAEDKEVEKVLVLKNPEPGTYTTEWVEKKSAESSEETETEVQETSTAKDLIDKINAATSVEDVEKLVTDVETRVTVKNAASKKIEDLKK